MRILTKTEPIRNPFEEKPFRAMWSSAMDKWLFSAVDMCAIFTNREYQSARKYWNNFRYEYTKKQNQPVRISDRLNFTAQDKKQRFTDVLDTIQVIYLLQIIPDNEANLYRIWLAEAAAAGLNVAKEIERLAEKNAVPSLEHMRQTVTREDMLRQGEGLD